MIYGEKCMVVCAQTLEREGIKMREIEEVKDIIFRPSSKAHNSKREMLSREAARREGYEEHKQLGKRREENPKQGQ